MPEKVTHPFFLYAAQLPVLPSVLCTITYNAERLGGAARHLNSICEVGK